MKSNNHQPKWERERLSPRIHTVKEISVHYEGRAEEVAIRPPDVSTHGMFFNTPIRFPEGTVLSLRFRLALTGAEIRTRCEVRYCFPVLAWAWSSSAFRPSLSEKSSAKSNCANARAFAERPSRSASPAGLLTL